MSCNIQNRHIRKSKGYQNKGYQNRVAMKKCGVLFIYVWWRRWTQLRVNVNGQLQCANLKSFCPETYFLYLGYRKVAYSQRVLLSDYAYLTSNLKHPRLQGLNDSFPKKLLLCRAKWKMDVIESSVGFVGILSLVKGCRQVFWLVEWN